MSSRPAAHDQPAPAAGKRSVAASFPAIPAQPPSCLCCVRVATNDGCVAAAGSVSDKNADAFPVLCAQPTKARPPRRRLRPVSRAHVLRACCSALYSACGRVDVFGGNSGRPLQRLVYLTRFFFPCRRRPMAMPPLKLRRADQPPEKPLQEEGAVIEPQLDLVSPR
jgi:hypothetical protein